MMSMKEAGKPVSFVEDCAVAVEHLAITREPHRDFREATARRHLVCARLGRLPARAAGTQPGSTRTSRRCARIAERPLRWSAYRAHIPASTATASCARNFMNHVRQALVASFEKSRTASIPRPVQSGKIVRAPKFDDRSLFRYPPDYPPRRSRPIRLVGLSGRRRRFQGASRCAHNGACRNLAGGFDVSELPRNARRRGVTLGRANSLRPPSRPARARRLPPTRWPKR